MALQLVLRGIHGDREVRDPVDALIPCVDGLLFRVGRLEEILSLNDPADSVQTRNLIAGVEAISAAPCVRRMQQSFVRGIEISLLLQDEKFSGDSAWMFARILNAFFSLYASINSFTVLRANTVGRSRQGLDAWRWPLEDGCRRTV